jgi:hypothetical protein
VITKRRKRKDEMDIWRGKKVGFKETTEEWAPCAGGLE